MHLILLPIAPFENVFQHLEFLDVVNLASCSRRMENMIMAVSKPFKTGITCDITLRRSSRTMVLKKENKKDFSWSSHMRRDYWAADSKTFVERKLDGRVWTVSPWDSGFRVIGINDTETLRWLKYFKKLFNFHISYLKLEIDHTIFTALFQSSQILYSADAIQIVASTLSAPQITNIFDNFYTEKLEISRIPEGYAYEAIVDRFSKITITPASWITVPDAWRMAQRCQLIELQFLETRFNITQLTWELREFIQTWLNSDNNLLEYLWISMPSLRINQWSIMEGINHVQGSDKRPEASRYFQSTIRYSSGCDIQRKDGVIATICCNEFLRCGFHFTVWQEADPSLD